MSNLRITFQPDETVKCFEMNIVDDPLGEEIENFSVTVSPLAGDVMTIDPTTACVMITDDDGMCVIRESLASAHIQFYKFKLFCEYLKDLQ